MPGGEVGRWSVWWIVWAVICCLLFLAIAVGLVVWGIGRGTGSRPKLGDPEEAPLDIARKWLAVVSSPGNSSKS